MALTYYAIFRDPTSSKSKAPTKFHDTIDRAMHEAKRLASLELDKFFVCKVIAHAEPVRVATEYYYEDPVKDADDTRSSS